MYGIASLMGIAFFHMRGCCRKFSTPSGRNSSMTNRYTYVTDECVRIAGAQPFPAAGIHTFRAVIRKHPVKIIRLVISLHIPSPDTGPGYIIRIRTHPFHIHARGNIVSGIRSEISAFQLQPIIACKQAVQLNTCANLTGNVIFWFQIKVRYPVIGFTLAVKMYIIPVHFCHCGGTECRGYGAVHHQPVCR